MPRNGHGVYTLPEPAFVTQTIVASAPTNTNNNDIAAALTDSVATDGQTPMTGPLKFVNGSAAAPSMTFAPSILDGFYWASVGVIGVAIQGIAALLISAAGILLPNGVTTSTPIGAVADWSGTGQTPPSGWLLAFGQAVSRTQYASLFNVIGTTFGAGDNLTTFNVPDLRGRNSYGTDNMGGVAAGRIGTVVTDGGTIVGTTLGSTGGSATHAQTVGEMPLHNHSITDNGHTHPSGAPPSGTAQSQGATGSAPSGTRTQSASTGIAIVSGGSGNAMSLLVPGVMINKMIFAGNP